MPVQIIGDKQVVLLDLAKLVVTKDARKDNFIVQAKTTDEKGNVKLGKKNYYPTISLLFKGLITHTFLQSEEVQDLASVMHRMEQLQEAVLEVQNGLT